jgi:hypothetical protein
MFPQILRNGAQHNLYIQLKQDDEWVVRVGWLFIKKWKEVRGLAQLGH